MKLFNSWRIIFIFFVILLGEHFIYCSEAVKDGFIMVSPSNKKSEYWRIEGDSATFLTDNWIEMTHVTVIFYDKKERKYHVTTSKAQVQKLTQEMRTEMPIEIKRNNLIINSDGMHFIPKEKKIVMYKNVRIETVINSKEDLL